jgi:hypothetical protein
MSVKVERYNAVVTKNDDDKKRGRIKVKSAELTGDPDAEVEWIEPVLDWGMFLVPDIGEEVEIEAIVEDDQNEDVPFQAFLDEPRIRWRGKRFESEEGKEPRPPHPLFTGTNYGKRRGFSTPLGHVLMFDDTEGAEQITMSWTNKAGDKFAYISFDKTGSALLSNQNGAMIHLDAENAATNIIDAQPGGSNLISMDAAGVKVIDKFSNIIELKDGAIQILSQKGVVVQGGTGVNVKAPAIALDAGGDADVFMVRGDDLKMWIESVLKAWADTHVHPTTAPGSPTGPAAVPLNPPPATILSTAGKVK